MQICQSTFQRHNITSTPRRLSNPHRLPSAPILDSTVDEFPSERLLGITTCINNDISLNTHVETVIKEHYLLSRIKVVFSFQNRRQRFYNAFILPYVIGVVLFGVILLQS